MELINLQTNKWTRFELWKRYIWTVSERAAAQWKGGPALKLTLIEVRGSDPDHCPYSWTPPGRWLHGKRPGREMEIAIHDMNRNMETNRVSGRGWSACGKISLTFPPLHEYGYRSTILESLWGGWSEPDSSREYEKFACPFALHCAYRPKKGFKLLPRYPIEVECAAQHNGINKRWSMALASEQ